MVHIREGRYGCSIKFCSTVMKLQLELFQIMEVASFLHLTETENFIPNEFVSVESIFLVYSV